MRSRYTAFVVGDEDYLFRTWHPRTRPEGPYCHPGTRWTGLTIHETVDGGADDEAGIVEFTATYRTGDGRGGVVDDALRGPVQNPGAARVEGNSPDDHRRRLLVPLDRGAHGLVGGPGNLLTRPGAGDDGGGDSGRNHTPLPGHEFESRLRRY